MNPTTHPYLFRKLVRGDYVLKGDVFGGEQDNVWLTTAGEFTQGTNCIQYYRKIEPTMNNNKRELIIKVNKSGSLFRAVETVLFAAGYQWISGGQKHLNCNWTIHAASNGMLYSDASELRNPVTIDAATEFGKLVELLEAPPEVKIKLQNHEAVVKGDRSGVQIGCKFATKDVVRRVRESILEFKSIPPVIRVTDVQNPTLRLIVLRLFNPKTEPSDVYWNSDFDSLIFRGGKYATQDYNPPHYNKDAPSFSAATEMGKLIEHLEGTRENKITISLRNEDRIPTNRVAVITDKGVTIMGETITKEQVEEIWTALQ